jgi:ubiquinone/menaquinone biosynthesis C-methylase UbiE
VKSDTADQHWNDQWKSIEEDSNWLTPEKDVQEWAAGLARGARILDLGAGVGRHALWLTAKGFDLITLDAAPSGLVEIDKASGVETVLARMNALPFKDHTLDRKSVV